MGSSHSESKSIIHYSTLPAELGETRVFRAAELPFGAPVVESRAKDMDTVLKCFESSRERLGPNDFFGTREILEDGKMGKYVWKSFDRVYWLATNLAKACQQLDLCPVVENEGHKTKPLGIFCKTREEWVVAWIASWYIGGCAVPLYDTLGDESIEWIIKQGELKTVVSISPFILKLAKLKANGKLAELKVIIALQEPTKEELEMLAKTEIKLLRYCECVEMGEKSGIKLSPQVTPDSIATICYTSGTTANPKGVILTHRNYVSMIAGLFSLYFVPPFPGDTVICWLPLAHVFEQFVAVTAITAGVKIGFYSGDTFKLVEDLQELKPHYFGSVPRVFHRVQEQTLKEMEKLTGFKKYLLDKATASKLATLRKTGNNRHSLYDRFVFKKIREKLGGNIRVIFIGGAPLAPEILEMTRIWLSCNIVQGYGQTETTGPIFAQDPDDIFPASIGRPLAHSEAKLVDIPEMKYFSTDETDGMPTPRGELMLRGPAISPGYWKDPVMTKETFTKDGWIHTGDVGKMSPWGHMTIVDRKKHIFKLSQGEYIAPEKLENIYQQSHFISQIFVTGESYRTYIIAVIVPRQDTVTKWAKEKGVEGNYEELCKDKNLKIQILRDLEKIGKEAKCNGLELVKNICVSPVMFSVENGTMTPTMKIKRYQAGKMYEEALRKLYLEPIPDLK